MARKGKETKEGKEGGGREIVGKETGAQREGERYMISWPYLAGTFVQNYRQRERERGYRLFPCLTSHDHPVKFQF